MRITIDTDTETILIKDVTLEDLNLIPSKYRNFKISFFKELPKLEGKVKDKANDIYEYLKLNGQLSILENTLKDSVKKLPKYEEPPITSTPVRQETNIEINKASEREIAKDMIKNDPVDTDSNHYK